MSVTDFEIVTTTTGAVSIRNKVVNEIMHNPVGPWQEANDLYISQSRLAERLTSHQDNRHNRLDKRSTSGPAEDATPNAPLVLFDVGLGAASNALAAIHCAKGVYGERATAPSKPLYIVSFENNLSLLEFALKNSRAFDHMTGMESALESLLGTLHWQSPCGMITWDLRPGDFTKIIKTEAASPDIIFFDPYSPSVNREMWSLECFETLFRAMPRLKNLDAEPTTLFTYSVATPVRVAMLMAGFYVGFGQATGLKHETTVASNSIHGLAAPIDTRWWQRWHRSHTQMPYDAEKYSRENLIDRLKSHPQYC